MLRLLPDSPNEAFDIWQVSGKNYKPETGVTIDRKCCFPPYVVFGLKKIFIFNNRFVQN